MAWPPHVWFPMLGFPSWLSIVCRKTSIASLGVSHLQIRDIGGCWLDCQNTVLFANPQRLFKMVVLRVPSRRTLGAVFGFFSHFVRASAAADVTPVSVSVSTARVTVCATNYGEGCICPLPTTASTIMIAKSVTVTRQLSGAAVGTPAVSPTSTTTLTVTITTGIMPRNTGVNPINPDEDALVPKPAAPVCPGDAECDLEIYHAQAIVCYHISKPNSTSNDA
jgi:hypothetical protein